MTIHAAAALMLCTLAIGCAAPQVARPVVSRPPTGLYMPPLDEPQPAIATRPAAPRASTPPRPATEPRVVQAAPPPRAATPAVAEPGAAVPLVGFRPMRGQRATTP